MTLIIQPLDIPDNSDSDYEQLTGNSLEAILRRRNAEQEKAIHDSQLTHVSQEESDDHEEDEDNSIIVSNIYI